MIDVALDWQNPQRPWLRQYLNQVAACLPGGAAESHEEIRGLVAMYQTLCQGELG